MQYHVPPVHILSAGSALGYQRGTPFGGNPVQNRIVVVCQISGKIDSREERLEQPAAENNHYDVRGLRGSVRRGHGSGFYGREPEEALLIGRNSAKPIELGVGGLATRIRRMRILPRCVRLPSFQLGVRNRLSGTIQNTPLKRKSFAHNVGADKIVSIQLLESQVEKRADGL